VGVARKRKRHPEAKIKNWTWIGIRGRREKKERGAEEKQVAKRTWALENRKWRGNRKTVGMDQGGGR